MYQIFARDGPLGDPISSPIEISDGFANTHRQSLSAGVMVRERERQTDRQTGGRGERERGGDSWFLTPSKRHYLVSPIDPVCVRACLFVCLFVCVCVCV